MRRWSGCRSSLSLVRFRSSAVTAVTTLALNALRWPRPCPTLDTPVSLGPTKTSGAKASFKLAVRRAVVDARAPDDPSTLLGPATRTRDDA